MNAKVMDDKKQMNYSDWKIHPFAEAFPMMSDAEIDKLADSIKRNGQREPIKTRKSDGVLIDGRNRLTACCKIGVIPTLTPLDLDELETIELIADLNIDRRHLTQSQKAAAAAEYVKLVAEANELLLPGNNNSRHRPNTGITAAVDEAAEKFQVSKQLINDARTAIEGDAENAKKIASGEVSAKKAAKEVREKKAAEKKPEASKPDGKPNDPKDKVGNPIPKSLLPIFADFKDELQAVITEATRIEAKTLEIAKRKLSRRLSDAFTPIHRDGKDTFEQGDLGMFRHKVRKSMPHAVCIFCNGSNPDKCSTTDPVTGRKLQPCDGTGWMDKETFEKAKKIAK